MEKRRLLTARASAVVLVAVAAALTIHPSRPGPTYSCGGAHLTEAQIAAKFGVTVETLHRAHFLASVTNEGLCTMPERLRVKALRKADHPKPDHPGEAVTFRNLFLRSADGTIPEDGLLRAKAQLDRLRADPAMVAPAPGVSSGSWTSLGPGNIGGRVRSILINPSTPSTMLLGSVSGGIWRTTTGGASWSPVQDFMANLAVATMVAQPSDFNIQYAGTGEGFYNGDRIRGAGIFKSTNGGVTWSQLPSTTGTTFHYVNRLTMSANSSTLLAATSSGLYRSGDGGATFTSAAVTGIVYGVTDVDFHPADSSKAVAGGFDGQAWYSINGGVSFIQAAGLPAANFRRVETAYAPSAPNIVYAAVDANGGQLYKSVDGGVSYTLIPDAAHPNWLGGQGWYDNTLFVDPTNPSVLIVGGIDLFRSMDGGATFAQISTWWASPLSAHADHHLVVAMPGFNGTSIKGAFFGNDGGIYGTDDIYTVGNDLTAPFTNGWQEYNNNLAITQFYGAGAHEATGKVMGGTQDNGTLTYTVATGTDGWVAEFGGDGGWSAIDQTDPNYCYGEYVSLLLHRSTTGCGEASGDWIYDGLGDAGVAANFIAPFILDPNDQRRLLAGGQRLWRTSDAKAAVPSWSEIKPANASGVNISAIAVQPGDPEHIWVGHNNGDVFKTTNGLSASPTWKQMDSGLPDRVVTRLAVDRFDDQIVYVTFGGFESSNIWKSINGGATWTNIHGVIPAAPIRSIVINPGNAQWLYVGTEVGIFTSENGGATWTLPHDGPANVSVDELFFSGLTLYAATHGRGIYTAGRVADPWPGRVAPISPNAFTGDATPTYRWYADQFATWYLLWVDDTTGTRVLQWFEASALGCAGGGICEITPSTALAVGPAKFWVRTWNSTGYGPWSRGLAFDTGFPTVDVGTYPVADVQPGYLAALWLHVRNTSAFALPSGSLAYYWVNGPGGLSGYVGSVDVSGIPAGTSAWYLLNWDVPVNGEAGTYTYWGRAWNTNYGGWLSPWSPGRGFTVLAKPAVGARIVSTYQVDGAVQGGVARTWALVRNVGSTPLGGRVWFNVYNVGWIGSAEVASLASGAEAWYSADWAIPAAQPVGTHWYLAQVWNASSTVVISQPSAWQPFTVGFTSHFTSGFEGFAAVTGPWSHVSNTYLYTAGLDNQFITVQYAPSSFSNLDFSARIWRSGDHYYWQGLMVRGAPGTAYWNSGYVFLYAGDRSFAVFKRTSAGLSAIQNWVFNVSAIVPGDAWNVPRVVANGNSLSFYMNGTLIWSGTDPDFSAGKVGLGVVKVAGEPNFGFWVDYASLAGFGVPSSAPNNGQQELEVDAIAVEPVSDAAPGDVILKPRLRTTSEENQLRDRRK